MYDCVSSIKKTEVIPARIASKHTAYDGLFDKKDELKSVLRRGYKLEDFDFHLSDEEFARTHSRPEMVRIYDVKTMNKKQNSRDILAQMNIDYDIWQDTFKTTTHNYKYDNLHIFHDSTMILPLKSNILNIRDERDYRPTTMFTISVNKNKLGEIVNKKYSSRTQKRKEQRRRLVS